MNKKRFIHASAKPKTHIMNRVDHAELPHHYEPPRVVLLVKDPYWLHAYWDVSPRAYQSLLERVPAAQREKAVMILRMYDVTLVNFNGLNANRYFDLEIGHSNNWYVNMRVDNASYVGEIGIRLADGAFCALARSNHVQTPRVSYSRRTELMWMNVSEDKQHAPFVRTYLPGRGSATPAEVARVYAGLHRSRRGLSVAPMISSRRRRLLYLSEEDVKRYYSQISPALRDVIAGRFRDQLGRLHTLLIEGESEAERSAILARLPYRYVVQRLMVGSSAELVTMGQEGASEQLARPSSWEEEHYA